MYRCLFFDLTKEVGNSGHNTSLSKCKAIIFKNAFEIFIVVVTFLCTLDFHFFQQKNDLVST